MIFALPLSRTNETGEGNEIVPFFIFQNGHQDYGTEDYGIGGDHVGWKPGLFPGRYKDSSR